MRECDTFNFNNYSKRFLGLFRICCDFMQVLLFCSHFWGMCVVRGGVLCCNLNLLELHWIYIWLWEVWALQMLSLAICEHRIPYHLVSPSVYLLTAFVYTLHTFFFSHYICSQGHSTFFPIGCLFVFFPFCSLLSFPFSAPHYVFLPFLKFSCLVFHLWANLTYSQSYITRVILNRSSVSILVLFLILKKSFNFSPLVWAQFVMCGFYCVMDHFFYTPKCSFTERCWILLNGFSIYIEII